MKLACAGLHHGLATGESSYLLLMINEHENNSETVSGAPVVEGPTGGGPASSTVTAAPAPVGTVSRQPTMRSAVATFLWWLLLALVLAGGLVGTIVGLLVWLAATGSLGFKMDPSALSVASMDPGMLTVATLFSSLFTSIAGYVFYGVKSKRWWPAETADGKTVAKRVGVGLLAGVAVIVIMQLAAWLASLVGIAVESSETSTSVISMLRWSLSGSAPWLFVPALLLTVGVVGPVAEELVFRGLIGRTVIDSGFASRGDGTRSKAQTLLACLVAGLFFGVVHVTGLSAAGLEGAVVMTLVGAALTWLSSVKTRSLAPAVAAHVALNLGQLLLVLATL